MESPRYRAAEIIDINLIDITPKNGLAYDEIRTYSGTAHDNKCALRMDISTQLESVREFTSGWNVVSHEMFHLFQNGITNFKTSWLVEGTATWAEFALRSGSFLSLDPFFTLPASRCDLEDIVDNPTAGDSLRMWSRLVDLLDIEDSEIRISDTILDLEYTDGRYVFKDTQLRGASLIAAIFQTLDGEDDIVSHINSWPFHSWLEADQKSSFHNYRIFQLIKRVVSRYSVTDPELVDFVAAIDDFDNPSAPCF